MSAGLVGAIDWARPWLKPLAPWGQRLPDQGSTAARLNAVAEAGSPQFVAAAELPPGHAYEAFIADTGRVPTRNNLHDLFNGLVWQRHGGLKRQLNRLQAEQIARYGIGPGRGAVRDALTLFDENGALWAQPHATLLACLRRRDWHALFVEHRTLWAGERFEIFGHALIEQLATAPRKALTAHVLVADPLTLSAEAWAAKPFLPLPVLGLPGWWVGQGEPDFYSDRRVFRPAPALKSDARP